MRFQSAGRGRPSVVFVHGFACDGTDWRAQFDCLQQHTTVVTCDLRGHGLSPGQEKDCSIETYGADVAFLRARLNLSPVILVGHSMGCRVVLESYRAAPDQVAGIVLLDGSRLGAGEHDLTEAVRSRGYQNFVREFFEEMFLASGDARLKATIIARAQRLPEALGAPLLARLACWDATEAIRALDCVRVPLLAIQTTLIDSQNRRVPLAAGETSAWLDLLRERVPKVRVAILPGQGHFPQLECPEAVNALLTEFVADLR